MCEHRFVSERYNVSSIVTTRVMGIGHVLAGYLRVLPCLNCVAFVVKFEVRAVPEISDVSKVRSPDLFCSQVALVGTCFRNLQDDICLRRGSISHNITLLSRPILR